MSKPHNEKRVEFVSARIKDLQDTIAALQKILDNPDIGEKRVVEELGLDFAKYRRFVYDLTWINKATVSANVTDMKPIKNCVTCCWQELLWLDICRCNSANIAVAPTDTVETIDNIISELSEREQLVIHMRFEEGLFLDECAKRIGVTRGRAGEILKRAETRIKYKYDRLRLGDGKYGTIIGMQRRLEDDLEIKIKREIIEKLDCRIESLAALIKDAYNTINGAEEKQKESTSYVRLLRYTPLENLELSVRSYNCLKRAGYKCLNDFCDKTLTDIKKIRNIGRKSYEEIVEKLTEVGICLE